VDVKRAHLAGPTGAVSVLPVDGNCDATGVAEHDVETVAPELHLLAVVEHPPGEQVATIGGHLDVARRPDVAHPEHRRCGSVVDRVTDLFLGTRPRRRGLSLRHHHRRRESRRAWHGGRSAVRWLTICDGVTEHHATYREHDDRSDGRHYSALSRLRLSVAAMANSLAPSWSVRLAMTTCHPAIIPRNG
jgi:hypothetical protein